MLPASTRSCPSWPRGPRDLSTLARTPIREYSSKAQDAAIRHVGATALDFHAAFGLGEDPLGIGTPDADASHVTPLHPL